MRDEIDGLKLDWTDLETAGAVTRDLLRRLSSDKQFLRSLVYAVEERPELLAMCERHQLLDYIVIGDELDRGWRLRVHLSTDDHLDRPHDHRFSFSSLILTGGYLHTWHHAERKLYDERESDDGARPYQSVRTPDPREVADLGELTPYVTRFESPGCSYTLHHSVIHTTMTTPDTVSLFIRGPAEKDRSLIMDRDSGQMWWRYGQTEEPSERRRDKKMSLDEYRAFRTRLEFLGVI